MKRRPEHAAPERATEAGGKDVSPELSADSNAAAQLQVGQPDWAAVREVAAPMVQRTLLALELQPRETQLDRFVAILERSKLPEDRKEWLIDRLRTDESTAHQVRDSVERWFHQDNEATRQQVGDVLAAVSGALFDPDTVVSASPGTAQARAEAAIAELSAAQGASGEAILGLCRDLHLALWWEEEEEEEMSFEPTEG